MRNASPAERDSLRELAEEVQQRAGGTERLFLGSHDGVAKLEIRDSEALVRVRLLMDEGDRARLEFLNELGQVVEVYPPR